MTPGEETCGGRGSEWLTPRRRGINSSLKEKKTFKEVLKNGQTFTFNEVNLAQFSILLLRYMLCYIPYNVHYKKMRFHIWTTPKRTG